MAGIFLEFFWVFIFFAAWFDGKSFEDIRDFLHSKIGSEENSGQTFFIRNWSIQWCTDLVDTDLVEIFNLVETLKNLQQPIVAP